MKEIQENNVFYLYVPFSLSGKKYKKTANLLKLISKSSLWEEHISQTRIFYKFVSNKSFNDNYEEKKWHLYSINKNVADYQSFLGTDILIQEPKTVGAELCEVYSSVIDDIKLLYFGNPVGFIVYQIHCVCDYMDPQIVANTLYFLKKVSSTALHLNDKIPFFTLGALSNRLLRETFDVEKQKGDVQIFFHMEEISARSNYLFMGKLEVTAASSEISKNLYYLTNGFSDKYEYINDDQDNCIYYAPNGRIWGISAESSICLIKDINVDAVTKKQFKEFKLEYFILFSLLLFQKYTYFYFLTMLSNYKKMSTRDLHLYKKNIVDFETDFVFSVVAEIPQYKKVYEKMVFAFNLDKLYKNVYDPIVELNDRQKDRSDKIIAIIGIAFTVLSLLSIVADGYQVLQIFEWINADWIVILKIVIFAFVVLLIISALQIIKILFRRK